MLDKKQLSSIEEEIKEIKKRAEELFIEDEDVTDENQETGGNPYIRIKAFENIVEECKEEIKEANEEHIKNILSLLFGLDTDPYKSDKVSSKLYQFIDNILNNADDCCTEKRINEISDMTEYCDKLENILKNEYISLQKSKKSFFLIKVFKNSKKLEKRVQSNLKEISELKTKLQQKVISDSKILFQIILDNFYNIYIFLSFLIRVAVHNKDQIVLIEVANALDRIIKVIEPSFKYYELESKYLLYHYVEFEFKELRRMLLCNSDEICKY